MEMDSFTFAPNLIISSPFEKIFLGMDKPTRAREVGDLASVTRDVTEVKVDRASDGIRAVGVGTEVGGNVDKISTTSTSATAKASLERGAGTSSNRDVVVYAITGELVWGFFDTTFFGFLVVVLL